MLKKIGKYVAVSWLAFLLLMGNTPMEFIHLFTDHDDTVHVHHDGLVIEKKHHHCAFLSLTMQSFINDYKLPFIVFVTPRYFSSHATIAENFIRRSIIRSSLRGPPGVL